MSGLAAVVRAIAGTSPRRVPIAREPEGMAQTAK
jgi:hypothetical protein